MEAPPPLLVCDLPRAPTSQRRVQVQVHVQSLLHTHTHTHTHSLKRTRTHTHTAYLLLPDRQRSSGRCILLAHSVLSLGLLLIVQWRAIREVVLILSACHQGCRSQNASCMPALASELAPRSP